MVRPAYQPEQVEAIQRQIMDATVRVFRRDGYPGVSLRAIAAEMGLSATALYRYFPSKDDLIAAVRAAGYEQMRQVLEAARARGTNPLDAVTYAFRDYLSFAFEEPELFRLMYDLNQTDTPAQSTVREARARAFDTVRHIASAAIDAGLLAGEPNLLAHLAWINAHGLALLASTGQLELGLELDDLIDPLIDQFLATGAPTKGVAP